MLLPCGQPALHHHLQDRGDMAAVALTAELSLVVGSDGWSRAWEGFVVRLIEGLGGE